MKCLHLTHYFKILKQEIYSHKIIVCLKHIFLKNEWIE